MALAAVLLGVIVAINMRIDPYGLALDPKRLASEPSGNEARPGAFWRKAFAVRNAMPRTIVLGTSRAEGGIDPIDQRFPSEYRPVLNLALGAASVGQMRELLTHANATSHLRMAVIGLDMESFLDDGRPDFDAAALRGNPESEPEALTRLRIEVSQKAFAASLARWIATAARREPSMGEQTVDSPSRGGISAADLRDFDGQRGIIWASEFANFHGRLRYLFPRAEDGTTWSSDPRRAAAMSDFHGLLKYARAEGIELRMFISPVHARYLEWYRRVGWWPLFEAWKRALVNAIDDEAKAAGSVPFTIWDFSGFHPLALEPVPRIGDQATLMRWYRDTSHYSPEMGSLILARILGETPPDVSLLPDDRLSRSTIDRQLAETRAGADRYRAEHPGEAANVAEIVAYLRRVSRK